MLEKKLLGISLVLITIIATMHILALQHDWYFTYRWVDFLMHLIGGIWIVVTTFWIILKTERRLESGFEAEYALVILLAVLIISIGWELFEIWIGNTSLTATHYWADTALDFAGDIIGGGVAYLCVLTARRSASSITKIQK